MEFATYSDAPAQFGGTIKFGRGAVAQFVAKGFERCTTAPVKDEMAYHTPTGPLITKVVCESPPRTAAGPLELGWTLSYR
jgi:hypothetical protein